MVDNLPPELITTMMELGAKATGDITRIAVVIDVRSRAFTRDLSAVIKDSWTSVVTARSCCSWRPRTRC